MADSIKYTVYPSAKKQSAALLLIVLGAVILTGIMAFVYLRKAAPGPEINITPVAPMVPNTPVPNPH